MSTDAKPQSGNPRLGQCPNCGAAKQPGPECPQCGVIYAKAEGKLRPKNDKREETTPKINENLTRCPTCDREISKRATACPHCGDPIGPDPVLSPQPAPQGGISNTRKNFGIGCMGMLVLLGIFAALNSPKENKPVTTRQAAYDKCFTSFDGSHNELTVYIKEHINDPDSYKHDETTFSYNTDHCIVLTAYRGTNKFGGVVRNYIKAKTDANTCAVLQVLEQGQL